MEHLPTLFAWENVKGFLSAAGQERARRMFAALGKETMEAIMARWRHQQTSSSQDPDPEYIATDTLQVEDLACQFQDRICRATAAGLVSLTRLPCMAPADTPESTGGTGYGCCGRRYRSA